MATVTLHPDPSKFPIGTAVKVYEVPANAPVSWVPSGAALSEPTVEAGSGGGSSVLTVTGVTVAKRYIAEATVSGTRQVLGFNGGDEASGAGVTSVNSKTGAVELTAEDVGAVGTVSPAFTGNPTAPTQAEGNSSTRLATTAFTAAAKAAATADAVTKDTAAREAAEAASTPRQAVHATATAGTLTANQLTPVDATAGNVAMKLPTGQAAGTLAACEKLDGSANEVLVEGSIRGVEAQTIGLKLANEAIVFIAKAGGSWWPLASHKTIASQDARYRLAATAITIPVRETASIPGAVEAGTVPLATVDRASKAVKVYFKIIAGTKVTFKLQNNGVDMAGFTGLEATKAAGSAEPAAVTLADGDELTLVVTAVEGAPKGFHATLKTTSTV